MEGKVLHFRVGDIPEKITLAVLAVRADIASELRLLPGRPVFSAYDVVAAVYVMHPARNAFCVIADKKGGQRAHVLD